jgi:hypothetical protein
MSDNRAEPYLSANALVTPPARNNRGVRRDVVSLTSPYFRIPDRLTTVMSHNSAEPMIRTAFASRRSLVVIQHPTQSRTATNPARLSSDTVDQPVPKTLVIALPMIVGDEFVNGLSEMALTERNHSVEALLFDRSDEALRVRICIRCPHGR